jgi:flagellar motor switch protein FliM
MQSNAPFRITPSARVLPVNTHISVTEFLDLTVGDVICLKQVAGRPLARKVKHP